MPKHTAILFPKTLRMLQQFGANIRLARLRRNVTAKLTAERAGISVVTLSQIERGAPTVALGNYVQVLVTLNLEKDILKVAADDELGRKLQDLGVDRSHKRASRKRES